MRCSDPVYQRRAAVALCGCLAFGSAISAQAQTDPTLPLGADAGTFPQAAPERPIEFAKVTKSSTYVTMPDGVRIAIDVYRPSSPGKRLPAVLTQTRYYRAPAIAADPVRSCQEIPPDTAYMAQRGYVVIIADVRGTGASFGHRTAEFSNLEVRDGASIADWIVAQPWSNGRIGVTGISYSGTTAEFMLRNHHKAVVAALPISDGYDFYADVIFPGGLRNIYLSRGWSAGNAALDTMNFHDLPELAGLAGPCPVDGDAGGVLLRKAVSEHAANVRVNDSIARMEFRDDTPQGFAEGWPSAYRYKDEIDNADVPFLQITGWTDSGYTQGAIHRFLNSSSAKQRLLIAAGSHGLDYFYAPGVTAPVRSGFNLDAERVRFFDRFVRQTDNGYDRVPRVRWFTTGQNRWHGAVSLPEPRMINFQLAPGMLLPAGQGAQAEAIEAMPGDIAAGDTSRWDTTLGAGPVAYPDRAAADAKLISFTSAPLARDTVTTGNAVLHLKLRTPAHDTAVIAYLEEVKPDGRAFYVTEGELLASHAADGLQPYRATLPPHSDTRHDALSDVAHHELSLTIGLQPMSHQFAAGSRLRIVLGAGDKPHFATPDPAPWRLAFGGAEPSQLDLPVER